HCYKKLLLFIILLMSRPTVTLQPNWSVVFRGETVTLRCEIQDDGGRTQWNYEWSPANRNAPTSSEYRISSVSESDMSKPTVTLQPKWPVYRGEMVTLRCEIQDDGGTQWTYEWRPTNRDSPTSSEYRINRVSESDRGEYSCVAKRGHQLTVWSDAFTLTVRSYKPRAKLTADITIIPLGGSVTLSCSVDGSSDWKFDWVRNGQQYSDVQPRGNTEPFRVIYVSEGGVYSCRGGRGDPVFHTGTILYCNIVIICNILIKCFRNFS
uniref:Ig-like domain-containing protein n=1 Tax=Poecilia reticulata TaxID=8081 RepID=A0A3P9N1R6_POERE